jgi:hypothetical protein
MFYIAIPIIPIVFIADTFYIDRFCSDRFHTDTFHTDMFCLCTGFSASFGICLFYFLTPLYIFANNSYFPPKFDPLTATGMALYLKMSPNAKIYLV